MKYEKPELVGLGIAISVIENTQKESDPLGDSQFTSLTQNAYQSDE